MKDNTTQFKIESNISVPDLAGRDRRRKYPLPHLKIGDSFFIPISVAHISQVRSAITYYHIRHPEFDFTVKAELNGCRVWRIAGKS